MLLLLPFAAELEDPELVFELTQFVPSISAGIGFPVSGVCLRTKEREREKVSENENERRGGKSEGWNMSSNPDLKKRSSSRFAIRRERVQGSKLQVQQLHNYTQLILIQVLCTGLQIREIHTLSTFTAGTQQFINKMIDNLLIGCM